MQDAGGNDGPSFSLAATNNSVAIPLASPSPPTGLVATAIRESRIELAWSAPGSDGGSAVTGYRIEVSADGGLSWSDLVPDTGSTDTGYQHTGLSIGDTRRYRVSAINAVGPGSPSNEDSATIEDTPPAFDGGSCRQNTCVIEFDQAIDIGAGRTPPASAFTLSADGAPVAAGSVAFGNVAGRGTVSLSQTAPPIRQGQAVRVSYTDDTAGDDAAALQDAGGNDVASFTETLANDSTLAPAVPDPPTGLAATARGADRIDLSWTAPADNGGRSVSGYRIEWSADGNAPWQELVNDTGATATTYSDSGLSTSTTRHYRVSARNSLGAGDPSEVAVATTNSAPAFDDGASATRSVAENSAGGTNVGAAVAASDADSDTLAYTLEGAGAASFGIVPGTGQIQTRSGVDYDHEAQSSHALTVKADDGKGGTAAIAVTISVTDTDEPPAAPAAPSVSSAAGTIDSLDVSWSAPGNAGKPAISGYGLQYRAGGGAWADWPHAGTGTAATIAGLEADTAYEARVRASNDEGAGPWSPPGAGRTRANSAPAFDDGASATRSVAENSAGGTNVGAAVAASDADSDTLAYTLEDAGAAAFEIVSSSGQLRTKSGVTYDHEAQPSHALTVKADDGKGGTAAIAVTISVTDEDEPPAAPAAPSVSSAAGTTDSLDVSWSAPGNAGKPAIAGYGLQYRTGDEAWADWPHAGTGTAATIAGLEADTGYEARVRASNDEGTGEWSPAGTGRTNVADNSAPAFDDGASATRSVAENAGAGIDIGAAVAASDADSDPLAYTLEGAGAASFGIVPGTGQIQTKSGVTYDHEAQPSHAVTVKADDGKGGTAAIAVTISVTDTDEPPAAPAAPSVSAAGTTDSLDVSWSAPGNAGKPAISGYEVQYRTGGEAWADSPHAGTGTAATIAGLEADTAYEARVRASNDEGAGAWSPPGAGRTRANSAPAFDDGASATRSVAENAGAGIDIGAAVAASDADSDPLAYTLEGAGAASFGIVPGTGQIQTRSGVSYDHEAQSSHAVTVKADDGKGGTATIAVTISVTDTDEPPAAPTAPSVSFTAGTTDSLDVSWSAPGNAGKPAISGYELQYRTGGEAWADWPHGGTGTAATIAGLEADTAYEARVRASNDEGTGEWSPAGAGRTRANRAPAFDSGASATRSVAENAAAGIDIGAAVAASDADSDPLAYTLEGAGAASFEIVSSSGQIRTRSGVDYDHEAESSYAVTVKADDGMGGTAAIAVTISVTDADEPPAAPSAPSVSSTAGTTDSLDVGWSAPDNLGKPAISGYELQYRTGGEAWAAWPHGGTGTAATIAGLEEDTAYEARVRASNDEGTGEWSPAGAGQTNVADNSAPAFDDGASATRSVAENNAPGTNVGTAVVARDADSDPLIYTLEGADAGSFGIVPRSGQIRTRSGVDYDHEAESSYAVTVKADDGMGGTAAIAVTISVTDADEPPAAPAAPSVSAAGTTDSLDVSWSAPGNAGKPAISGYELQYRTGGGAWAAWPHGGTGTAATIAGLEEDTAYEARVRASNDEGTGEWSPAGAGRTNVPANSAPAFDDGASATRSVAENSAVGTNVGAAVAASDADSDTLAYTLESAGAASFEIVSSSGQLRTKTGVTYDHEAQSSHAVTVKADDGKGGTATIAVTISVTDADEPPAAPAAPSVSSTAGTTDSLDVSWSAPGNAGKPAISGYGVQYRTGGEAWADWAHGGTVTAATIAGLEEDTAYEARVRASNDEGTGEWSPAGAGRTNVAANSAPAFDDGASATRSVAENAGAGIDIGAAVAASDADSDTLAYTLEGADAASFGIVPGTGQIRTKSGVDYDHEAQSSHAVTVKADDGKGGTAAIAVTISVIDTDEPPAAPTAPSVSAAGTIDSLDVSWSAPGNAGKPAIAGYGVQYRTGGEAWADWAHGGTVTAATITGLEEDTAYEARVRASNDEGTGEWSPAGAGRTRANSAPAFDDGASATRSVAENSAAGTNVGAAVAASDADSDTLAYTLEGAGAASFEIVSSSGQLRTKTGVTYDHEAKSSYAVAVKADDSKGGTATIEVTINVTDADEPPAVPAAPSVSSAAGSTRILNVSWSAPDNAGKPAISGYEVQYRTGGGAWGGWQHSGTGTAATITGLEEDTAYEVQARAINDEGAGGWSPAGAGRTNVPENSAPEFDGTTAARSVAENSAAGTNIGTAVAATDADSDTLTYTLEGADAASFAIMSTSGQIRTETGVDYDHEAQSSHAVTVKADDGKGGTATIALTISVTDADEPPAAPAAPSVSSAAGTTDGLDVSWRAPDNAGRPAITGYEVQYRTGGGAWSGWPHGGTGTAAMITGLEEDTAYEVQARAINDEGPGEWSAGGRRADSGQRRAGIHRRHGDAQRGREHRGEHRHRRRRDRHRRRRRPADLHARGHGRGLLRHRLDFRPGPHRGGPRLRDEIELLGDRQGR